MKPLIIAGLIFFILVVVLVVLLPFFLGFGPVTEPFRAGELGFFISRDYGLNWQAADTIKNSKTKLSRFTITDFVIDPKDARTFYLGTRDAGLWKSMDAGESWEKIMDKNQILDPGANILRLVISSNNPKLWFVALYQKNRGWVLKSQDGGATFSRVYFVPVERFGVFDLWYDDTSASIFIVTGQGGLLESSDQGKSWRVIKWFPDGIVSFVPDLNNRSAFYLLSSRGQFFKTRDRGKTWLDLTSSFEPFDKSRKNQRLIFDQSSGTLYLGSDYGLLRSRDNGITWENVPVIIPPKALPVFAISIHPRDSKIFYISAVAEIYKTTDGGTTWSIIPSPTGQRITELVIDRLNPAVMYLVSNR